eukprot:gene6196-biopygen22325
MPVANKGGFHEYQSRAGRPWGNEGGGGVRRSPDSTQNDTTRWPHLYGSAGTGPAMQRNAMRRAWQGSGTGRSPTPAEHGTRCGRRPGSAGHPCIMMGGTTADADRTRTAR